MDHVRIIIGPPAQGSDFWDREMELAQIWKALDTSSVLLSAPRRFGKTSLMLRLKDKPKSGWQAYYLDTEWHEGPEDFVVELIAQICQDHQLKRVWQKAKKLLGGVLKQIEVLKIARQSRNEAAGDFLHWFRAVRQMPELQDHVRWVTGGSVGINKVLQRVGAGVKTINDLQVVHVREYSSKQAKAHIKALLNSEGLKRIPPQVLDKFLKIIEIPIPFFIQILVRESLNEMERQARKTLDEAMVEAAYEGGVLAVYNRTYFEHYHERLSDTYDASDADIAKRLLTEVARRQSVPLKELKQLYSNLTQGKGDEDTFSFLLSELENDFYLVRDKGDDGNYRFATKVLKDWWRRYYS